MDSVGPFAKQDTLLHERGLQTVSPNEGNPCPEKCTIKSLIVGSLFTLASTDLCMKCH